MNEIPGAPGPKFLIFSWSLFTLCVPGLGIPYFFLVAICDMTSELGIPYFFLVASRDMFLRTGNKESPIGVPLYRESLYREFLYRDSLYRKSLYRGIHIGESLFPVRKKTYRG